MNAYKESPSQSEWRRGTELELSEVQRMCPWNSGMKSRWRIDMRSHLAWRKTTRREQNERHPHSAKSGSRTTNEEQPHKLRKTVRFEQEAPSTSSSSTVHVSLEYPESGRKKDPLEPVSVHYSGHVEDDIQISSLDVFCQVDGRESRCIKGVGLVSRRRCWRSQEK